MTRSRIAEAYFKKVNKNKNIKVKSAGLIKGDPVFKEDIKLAKKFGLDIRGRVKGISRRFLKWQTLTIIVADDVPPQIFDVNLTYGMKLLVWKIKDTKYHKNKDDLVKDIMKKVDGLVKKLEKEK
jgi:protein-tyrosine-phosphatase